VTRTVWMDGGFIPLHQFHSTPEVPSDIQVDTHPVGSGEVGQVTRQIQSDFRDAIQGRNERHRDWLTVV